MNFRKIISRRIRHDADGVNLAADVNAVVATNVNESAGSAHVSSKQRIVQKNGKTYVSETHNETTERGES